jgi:sec-independent protein translocase protein TatA
MFNNFGILDLSTPDLVIILAIVLLLFGAKKLPELSKSLGSSARELRKGFTDIQEAHGELKSQVKGATSTAKPTTTPAPTNQQSAPENRPNGPIQL